jgi:tetratricopeptide (TPR) repeat protein
MLAIKNQVGKYFAGFIAFAILLAGCTPAGPRALLQGRRLLEEGRSAEAVEKFQLATSLMATNAQAWNYLGVAYHSAGDATNAAQAYQQALKLNRDLVETHFNLGCLWLEQNRLENAKSELAAFTLRRGNIVEGWLKLGAAQLRSREPGAAEKSFGEALRLNQQNPEALNGLGMIQMQRNRARDAAQFFNAALQQQSSYSPALLNLAIVSQVSLNNRPFALQKYREYLALPSRPANWEVVNAAASALEQEINAASRQAVPVAAAPPVSNVIPARVSSNVVARPGAPAKPEPASNTVRTATMTLPPSNAVMVKVASPPEARVAQDVSPPATARMAQPVMDMDEPPKTEKRNFFQKINPLNLFRRSSKATSGVTPLPPGSPSPQPAPKAVSSPTSGVPESEPASGNIARYNYHSLPNPAPGNRSAAEKAFMQGLQAQRAAHLPEAMLAYRQATQLDPSYFEAYYNLALASMSAGDLPQALSSGESALAIRPESLDARLNFAQSLKQARYFLDAANELATVLAKYANDARANLALGNLYAQQFHQPAKAREYYLKVLDNDPRNPQAPAIRDWLVANPR